MTTKTYRGRSLEELLPKVRAELGPDAVIVRQREGLTGGVGGFFQKRLVEIEASAPDGAGGVPEGRIDVRDDSPATPDFLDQLTRAQAAAEGFVADEPRGGDPFAPPATAFPEADEFIPLDLPEVVEDDAWSGWRDPVPTPAVVPYVSEQVDALPNVDSLPVPGTVPGTTGGTVPGTELVAGAPRAPLPGRWPAEASSLRDALVARGVEAELADEVVEETVTHLVPLRAGAKLRPLLVSALARRIPVAPLGGLAGRVVAFVGPGGSGKTHCAARLAGAYAAADRMPVACVSIAPRDAGAELALQLAPSGVPLHTAPSGAHAADRVAPLRDRALVLVDTPGVSPRAKADLRALHAELRALGADDVLLTMPATTSAGAAREMLDAGRRVGATAVVLTHADETAHLGPAVGAAMQSGLPFAYVGHAEALRPAAAEELAGALVGAGRNGRG
jgi:flagellar biosynthesis protein FlhF